MSTAGTGPSAQRYLTGADIKAAAKLLHERALAAKEATPSPEGDWHPWEAFPAPDMDRWDAATQAFHPSETQSDITYGAGVQLHNGELKQTAFYTGSMPKAMAEHIVTMGPPVTEAVAALLDQAADDWRSPSFPAQVKHAVIDVAAAILGTGRSEEGER